jgi:hypothetical protein
MGPKNYINPLRAQYGLPPQEGVEPDSCPMLCLFSEKVFPRPSDWPSSVHLTGYWIMEALEEYHPPQELQDFLAAGPPPVYMGFGSMPVRDTRQLFQLFVKSCRATGNRGIFCGGWTDVTGLKSDSTGYIDSGSGSSSSSSSSRGEKNEGDMEGEENEIGNKDVEGESNSSMEDILVIKGAPHEWLLPRCLMAIHHGGAGTTAASLRAGIPTLICSVLIDQPFWAYHIRRLGVGHRELMTLKDLTAEQLTEQIRICSQPEVLARAREFGEELRKEDGVRKAKEILLDYCNKHRNPGHWKLNYLKDEDVPACLEPGCTRTFGLFTRRHHCMGCGKIYCWEHVSMKRLINFQTERMCCKTCAQERGL